MVAEVKIQNMNKYNTSMAKSLIDKMFFMDKIDESVKVVLDYGCADGTLVKFLAPLFPDMFFIGYDLDESMIEIAEEGCELSNVFFMSNLKELEAWFCEKKIYPDQCVVNLSSVIHEVYSYSTIEEVEKFWEFINHMDFGYIVIRDMCLDSSARRPSLKEDLIKVRSRYPADRIREFESVHGSLCDNYNLIHFLLKYRYAENWDREVRENYLPLSVEDIGAKVSRDYELVYFDHYILPFLANVVRKDFDLVLKDYTHVKFIYRMKEER